MSGTEKDDIMGLAFLVGSQINNLKKNSLGDGKFIHKNLEEPAEFVKKIASHDISKTVQQAKTETLKNVVSDKPLIPEINADQQSQVVLNGEFINLLKEISNSLKEINFSVNEIKTKLMS
jgi:hypothetical protein